MKHRSQTEELKMLSTLNARGGLTEQDQSQFIYLLKGYEGEVQFDVWLESLQPEHLILNDLLLEFSGSTFQIDSLLIMQNTVYLFEVKNYEGDYYYDGDKLKTAASREVKNPIIQLKRAESLLRQLLNSLGFNLQVKAYVIFINPEFALYQAPMDQPFILPNQLNRFMKRLNQEPSKLQNRHKNLAEKLLALHLLESPYARTHEYDYESLKKGIQCLSCKTIMEVYHWPQISCSCCGTSENIETATLRTIGEFKLLNPEAKVTSNAIYEWCGKIVPMRTIRRILQRNFKQISNRKWTYFI
ncbi:nuclease-related domain-containing protein [Bacillus sp. ISL-39]|uniref:nuclease-related domain-containing protein n=1 Tax=Bacillus sp. ISL-39 TaxID=2819124 RepID=UPI0020352E73|nr:nuclease-related domain-containing protein [Bacillus sp. ISL-39]